jgi:hypothetical protein
MYFLVYNAYLDEEFLRTRFWNVGRTDFELLPYAW